MSRLPAVVLVAMSLVACAQSLSIRGENGALVPLMGSTLVLHQDITIPPNRTRAYFQKGRQVPSGTGEFEPFCQVEVKKLLDTPQTVMADTFTVTKVSWNAETVVDAGLLRLAGVGIGGGIMESSPISNVFRMWLHSDRQPEVLFLICGGAFDDPIRVRDPTLADIRGTFGDIATFNTP